MQLEHDQGNSTADVAVHEYGATSGLSRSDTIAVEEPMEIRVQTEVDGKRPARSVSITMRTPGHDFELAVGFLYGEGLISSPDDVKHIAFCGPPAPGKPHSNIVRVELNSHVQLDLVKLQRNFYSTSSCGICGKASLDALDFDGFEMTAAKHPMVDVDVVHLLPERLRARQPVFDLTGGLHAAGLFDATGVLVDSREDVGRHNAVDKLIGAQVLAGNAPLSEQLLVVSGRVSFEILQKALAASIPVVVAVGAPSSLAVEMAKRFGMTLIGFARDNRFNVYCGHDRIR